MPAGSPVGVGQFVDAVEVCPLNPLNDKLRNTVAARDLGGPAGVMVHQVHEDLSPVPGIDCPGRVQHRDTKFDRQPGPRMDQPDEAIGKRHGDPGTDELALARRDLGILGREKVGPGVTRMGVRRQRQVWVQPLDRHTNGIGLVAAQGFLPPGDEQSAAVSLQGVKHPASNLAPQTSTAESPYTERLKCPWWAWVAVTALVALVTLEIGLGAPGARTWVPLVLTVPLAIAGLWWLGRIKIAVSRTQLMVDDAHLPLEFIADVIPLDAEEKRLILGAGADPLAFIIQRPWISTAVQIMLNDPADPTPYWVISTRKPEQLAAVLTAGRELQRLAVTQP